MEDLRLKTILPIAKLGDVMKATDDPILTVDGDRTEADLNPELRLIAPDCRQLPTRPMRRGARASA